MSERTNSEPGDVGHDETLTEPGNVGHDETLTSTGAAAGTNAAAVDSSDDLDATGASRYRLGPEHGRGGLGAVHRARDRQLGREVAIKELHERGRSAEARFVREALIAGRLEHPSIVPVHEIGRRPNGKPFYAMKLIAGRTLRELIADAKTLDERLALLPNVIAVADAIAYAHSQRIIHRDLKPSNIIVGDYGETVVIDWGLAKELGESECGSDVSADPYRTPAISQLTMAGQLIGTPAYMSPEQAAGEEVDERADVFSIGAILHELITGAPMYSGETTTGIIERARKRDSAPLMRKVLGIRRDRIFTRRSDGLVAIVERATAFDPAERYQNGSELAAALRVDRETQRIRSRLDWTDLLEWMVAGIWIAGWLPYRILDPWILIGALPFIALPGYWKRRKMRRATERARAYLEPRRKQELLPPGAARSDDR